MHYLVRRGGRLRFVTSGGGALFDKRRAHYDVALLRLDAAASATPIRLAGRGEARAWRAGATGVVAGWGIPGHGRKRVSDRPLSISMRRLGDATCARETGTWRASIKLCAKGARPGRGTCRGDSGSGLAVPVRTGRGPAYRLAGITNYDSDPRSRRTGCSRTPTTFARVSAAPLRTLIQRQVRALGGGDVVGRGARPR